MTTGQTLVNTEDITKTSLTGRYWGDGGGDKREHIVASISFTQMPMFIDCTCQTDAEEPQRLTAVTAAALAAAWQKHGGSVLGDKGFEDRRVADAGSQQARADAAVLAIREWTRRCTCETTDIEDCPNYIDGDEALDYGEEGDDE
jgi:hypothetical protein